MPAFDLPFSYISWIGRLTIVGHSGAVAASQAGLIESVGFLTLLFPQRRGISRAISLQLPLHPRNRDAERA